MLQAAYRQIAQADWLGPKVGGHWRCFCSHRVNRVNSSNALLSVMVLKIGPYLMQFRENSTAYSFFDNPVRILKIQPISSDFESAQRPQVLLVKHLSQL